MDKKDIARPHRLLINQSLRKEADKLKAHIDECKKRYEDQYQQNIEELKVVQNKLNSDLQLAKESILNDLAEYQDVMVEISNSIIEYVSLYYNRQILFKRKEMNSLQQKIVKEYIQFLSNQMNEIGAEIELLRTRIDLLSREASVDDVLQVIRASGNALPTENVYSAKELMDLVKERMDAIYDSDRTTWTVMHDLRQLLDERVSFLSEIQYIAWVIEQKRQLSKELKWIKNIELQAKDELKQSKVVIQNDIDKASRRLFILAKEIWAKQVVNLGGEIEIKSEEKDYLESEIRELSDSLNSCREELKSVKDDIEEMKSFHSNDSNRWKRLQEKKQDLGEKIASIKSKKEECCLRKKVLSSEIGALIKQRGEWRNTRKHIHAVLLSHSVPLIKIKAKGQYDDEVYAEIRMQELTDIAAESMKAAELIYKDEYERIKAEIPVLIDEKSSAIADQKIIIADLIQRQDDAENMLKLKRNSALRNEKTKVSNIIGRRNQQKKRTEEAEKKLDAIRSADRRFVIKRWLADSHEKEMAKAELETERQKLKALESQLIKAQKATSLDSIDKTPDVAEAIIVLAEIKASVDREGKMLEEINSDYDNQIAACYERLYALKPRPERPTEDERDEMQKIQAWSNARLKKERKH